MIHHVTPIPVLPLFPVLDDMLTTLLKSLSASDWEKPTAAKAWTVKDVAAHLLDGNLRTLSFVRDKYLGDKPDTVTYQDLVRYLNELNASWVNAAARLSPRVLTDLLHFTGKEYFDALHSLDPWEDALFPVAWAGEEISKNWFHIAREYTEKWIHQQQIRDAVGQPGLLTHELFYPFIDTFMCALPQTYKFVDATTGTSVLVRVTSEIGGEWHINKTEEGWVLRHNTRVTPNAVVEMDPDTAWRLFSRCIAPDEALPRVRFEGAEELGKVALNMVSVMA
ncbi:MAG: maleylpyruvate isomerase family mycothiol-dependent enzyme [Sphingobacteriales bacterium]|nr:MAG: maleylpyruvate isomerase family mycothiol-dependent enzyme [Sphingobacteriales bacterium]